ncbi:MAG TPA: hypothetical protein VFV34_10145, partial [Blastocatellia bacterium]|nr:hypothetical protein [Blastocatellia bacterium]
TEPLTLGVNVGYWGPPNRIGTLQPALSMDLGSHTNVTSLDFAEDALAPIETKGSFVEPITKMSLPIPPLPSLRVPPLAPIATKARRKKLMRSTANKNPGQAALSALADLMNAPDSVDATGEVDTVRFGHILRARQLVGVRGAGFTHNGTYKVTRVTHEIERGTYTQQFKLAREGIGSLLPFLPT